MAAFGSVDCCRHSQAMRKGPKALQVALYVTTAVQRPCC